MNLKTRYEELQIDYVDQLSNKEKEWLNAFNEGYVNADFRNPKTRQIFRNDTNKEESKIVYIKRKKNEVVKPAEEKTKNDVLKENIRELYNRNNARNRCIISREKAQNSLDSLDEMLDAELGNSNKEEDDIVVDIDDDETTIPEAQETEK